ncbi:MAG: MFS transporter [Acidobacteria bacterium]|nr:MFS transporter [Acidobacteriota bacterium]
MDNSKGRGSKKWGVVGLCFGALAMSSVVRISLGIAAPTLMKEFDISPVTMGYVLSGWNWAYTACQLIIGPVVDRFGSWIVLGLGAGVWSLSTIALPLATTALALFLFRAVFGIGHSMLIPAQASTISKWFRSEQRSTALGFAFSGSQVGSAVGAAVCALLLVSFGWRSVFYWIGAANLLFAVIWILFHPDKKIGPQTKLGPEGETRTEKRVSIFALLFGTGDNSLGVRLRNCRSAWGLAFGQAGYLYAYHFYISWLPSYFYVERGMTDLESGIVTSLTFWMGMIGTIGGGWLGDHLIRRGFKPTSARKTVVGVGMMVATVMVITAAYTTQTWLAATLLILCMGSLRATTGSANAMPIDLAPSTSVASLVSIQNFGGNVGGLMAPIVTGYIFAATGSFTGALVTAGAIMMFGAFSYVFIVGRLPEEEKAP